MYYVYALIDPSRGDDLFYIGKGSGRRLHQHLNGNALNENRVKAARIQEIRSRGIEPKAVFMFKDLTEEDAYRIESEQIVKYGREGIDEGGILTNRVIDCRSPQSEETRRRRSESLKGHSVSPEQRAKQSAAMKGRTMPPEEREKRRQAALGKKRGPYNWKISAEQRVENARNAGLKGGRPKKS